MKKAPGKGAGFRIAGMGVRRYYSTMLWTGFLIGEVASPFLLIALFGAIVFLTDVLE